MNRLSFFKTLALGVAGAIVAPSILIPKQLDHCRWKKIADVWQPGDVWKPEDYWGSWKFIRLTTPSGSEEIFGKYHEVGTEFTLVSTWEHIKGETPKFKGASLC